MNIKTIYKLQREYGLSEMQEAINSGMAWRLEGSVGRTAMQLLRSGACLLPKEAVIDAYGNKVPSRDEVVSGTLGSFENSVNFWSDELNIIELDEALYFEEY